MDGQAHRPTLIGLQSVSAATIAVYALGNFLVYGPLRTNLGSAGAWCYTAAAIAGPVQFTLDWCQPQATLCSTETAGFVCLQPDRKRAPTPWACLRGWKSRWRTTARFWSSRRSTQRLLQKPERPRSADSGGWYHTSDAGFLDAHGHLKIIDRVKDVAVSRVRLDGAMFAPKYVENKLKFSPTSRSRGYGDGRDKVCVMINIDFRGRNWAERRNLPYAANTDLAQKTRGLPTVKDCVEKVNAT